MTTKSLLDREPVLRYLRKLTEQRLGKRAPVGVGADEVTVTGASVRTFPKVAASPLKRASRPKASLKK